VQDWPPLDSIRSIALTSSSSYFEQTVMSSFSFVARIEQLKSLFPRTDFHKKLRLFGPYYDYL